MGNRKEPRNDVVLPVRVFGTDADGRVFSEKTVTVNISQRGMQVSGIKVHLKVGEIVGISHDQNKGRFKVQWVGSQGTPAAGHVGLLNIHPEKPFWTLPVPAAATDTFQPGAKERRKYTRVRCTTSVELHPEGTSIMWGKASDLSLGGCYVEMPIPLNLGTKVKVGIWMGEAKCWVQSKVTNSTPGFGIGLQFIEMSDSNSELLTEFLKNLKDT
jgi:hypothetical protein